MTKNEKKRALRLKQYQESDNIGRLIINLRDISHTMRYLYEGKGSQKRILIYLYEAGSTTQRVLTEWLDIKPGSASEVFAKMENAGLIERIVSDEDRRTAVISLTEDGKKLAIEAAKQRSRRHEEMFSSLSESEKSQLLSLLEKINEDWEVRYQNTDEFEKKREPHHKNHRGHDHHGKHEPHEEYDHHGKHTHHGHEEYSERDEQYQDVEEYSKRRE